MFYVNDNTWSFYLMINLKQIDFLLGLQKHFGSHMFNSWENNKKVLLKKTIVRDKIKTLLHRTGVDHSTWQRCEKVEYVPGSIFIYHVYI